ncbi:hemolysin family protein [Jeotgalibaca caeni]|uniref:hemolysin family protein n=1 Tax=Jeotgalibaca caeni TaxID=3028623 RepID=UPI00237D682E|nr:hemolysin family protein [Jeotgalibaca caeni]MDE1547963.1 hemolysin family protein [Jeotgalibaca caeni]
MNADPDSQTLIWQLLLIVVLTMLNAFFAASEIAFVSLNKNKVANQAIKGSVKARKILALLDNSDDFLATIQVTITFAGFLSSASAANTFASKLEPLLSEIPGAEQVSILVVTLLLSYVSLVFGELFPKQVALQRPEQIAYAGAGFITNVQKVFKPFVRLLSFSTRILEKLTPIKFSDDQDRYSREEVRELLERSSLEGTIEATEFRMLKGVLAMDNKMAREIMVPRTETFMLDIQDDSLENIQAALNSPYTRIPVYDDDKDDVIGVLHLKNLLKESRKKPIDQIDLRETLNEPLYVPETILTDELMAVLKRSHNQLALLHDEYGGMVGIVTLEDILEEIVGDIEDEYDESYVLIEKKRDNYYEVDGGTPLYRFNDFFGTNFESSLVDTIAGYLLTELGDFPEEDEAQGIEEEGMRISILEIESNRIAKVSVEYVNGQRKPQQERLIVEEIPKQVHKDEIKTPIHPS